jgi:hypothetical protein
MSERKNNSCVDPMVGGILASWRYDISGIAPEMRFDYEQHFVDCAKCTARQRLHRRVDISLVVLAICAAVMFVAAFGAVTILKPSHTVLLQIGAAVGFLVSVLLAVFVAIATPAPIVVADAARTGARRIHDRLPEELRERLPIEVRTKILQEVD